MLPDNVAGSFLPSLTTGGDMVIARRVKPTNKTPKMLRLEEAHQAPIEILIAQSFEQHGRMMEVAADLEISPATLSDWLVRLQSFWVLAIPREEEIVFAFSLTLSPGRSVRFIG